MTLRDRWTEIEPILVAALDLPETDRADFVARACGRDHDLMREVSALLDAHGHPGPLDNLAVALGVSLADSWSGAAGTPPPWLDETWFQEIVAGEARAADPAPNGSTDVAPFENVTLGGYTLERLLGRGGMGSVWLARRTDGRFEGRAAVKLLNLALLSATGQERFRREGSVLARLAHPGVARLLDAGVTAAGQPFLVLEYIDGERIDAFVERRQLTVEGRIRLILQVLAAVEHAHANLIVHRDLKPSNIIVTRDGDVKLLDFGIAKLLDADGTSDRTALTVDGGRPLTPEFAAPEQVQGEPITTATDVYALGVLLYLVLSGRHPTSDASGARTMAGTFRRLLEVEPPRLGLGDLDAVLGKALRKSPRERYQTAAAFAEDLERYLRREPVRAKPDSLAYRANRFVRRNRAGVIAVAVTFAALLGATLFSVEQMQRAERQRDLAVQEKRRGDAIRDFQYLMMSRLGDRAFTLRELLDEGRATVEREHVGDPAFLGVILVDIASRYAELGENKIGGVLLARAESLALSGQDREMLPEIRCRIAENLRVQGRLDEASQALTRMEATFRTHVDPYAEMVCLASRSELQAQTDQPAAAEQTVRRAIAIHDSLGEPRQVKYLGLLNTLAGAYESQRRFREGMAVNRRTIALLDSLGRGNTTTGVILQHNLGTTLINLGEIAEAERVLRNVLARYAKSDPSGRLALVPLSSYAQVTALNEHVDSSLKYYRILAERATEEGDSSFVARGLYGLTRAHAKSGQVAAARQTYARFRTVSSARPTRLTDEAQLAGWIAKAEGDSKRSHAHFTHALRIAGYYDGKRGLHMHTPLVQGAETGVAIGRYDDALEMLAAAESISTYDSVAEARSSYLGEVRLVRARALLARGDTIGARTAINQARVALRVGAGGSHARTREADALARMLLR